MGQKLPGKEHSNGPAEEPLDEADIERAVTLRAAIGYRCGWPLPHPVQICPPGRRVLPKGVTGPGVRPR